MSGPRGNWSRGRGRGGGGYRGGGGGRGGGGYRGRGRGGNWIANGSGYESSGSGGQQRTQTELDQLLQRIDGAGYAAYKDLYGSYKWTDFGQLELFVDYVQGDPYAPPSRLRARLPMDTAGIPEDIYDTKLKKIAVCDYLARQLVARVRSWKHSGDGPQQTFHGYGGPKGGEFIVYQPKQQVLERTTCTIGDTNGKAFIEVRFTTVLPANGRSINSGMARKLLITQLPRLMELLIWDSIDKDTLYQHVRSVLVQQTLRDELGKRDLVAFVGNGSILPRASGVDLRPMQTGVVPFASPKELEIEIDTGIRDIEGKSIKITGMGIPRGITVITGGGFHGKTTLLEALEMGIYNVIPGDGRELVVTEPNAFKVRSEDGRNVVGTDISPFISNLPGRKPTDWFTSMDASGSTSMAANIQEALELNATTLIIDEDTSATNFLVRDNKMHELIRSEPIAPFVSKVAALFRERAVSTLIVIGGCGDYLNVATTVIGTEDYRYADWTARAKAIAAKYPNAVEASASFGAVPDRVLQLPNLHSGKPPVARGDTIVLRNNDAARSSGDDGSVDISGLEQIVEPGQAKLVTEALRYMSSRSNSLASAAEWAGFLEGQMSAGLDGLHVDNWLVGDLVQTRPLELVGAVNRVRGLQASRK